MRLRGPAEQPSETTTWPDLPDHHLIMIIAVVMIAAAVTIHSQQKKHPAWKRPADILFGVGIALTAVGILYQSYLISIRNGQHLNGIHTILGIIATILIIPVLIFWNRRNSGDDDQKNVWIVFLWVVTTIVCLILGIRSVGIA